MSVDVLPMPVIAQEQSPVHSSPHSDSSLSDSDPGYVTPVEHFADDEHHAEEAKEVQRAPVAIENGLVMVEPELREKIVQQVEWYFSDENLLKDSFLMKHINRNKQGFVSLKLVASLRKVKALSKDWQVVLQSLRESTTLALNEEGTKVRRLQPAPQVDYTHTGRTILVANYPSNEPTIQEIEQLFGKHGEVTLVRILHPGRAIPLDVKPCRANHPVLGKELCILVEFESVEGAKKACKKYRSEQSWRDEVKVELLDVKGAPVKSKEKIVLGDTPKTTESKRRRKANDQSKATTTPQTTRWSRDDSKSEVSPFSRHSRESSPAKQVWTNKNSQYASSDSRRWHQSNLKSAPEQERARKYLHPDSTRDYASDSGYSRASSESPKNSPEPTKRFFSGDLSRSWRKSVHLKDSCVIRSPLGPDGTRGFVSRRTPVHVNVQTC